MKQIKDEISALKKNNISYEFITTDLSISLDNRIHFLVIFFLSVHLIFHRKLIKNIKNLIVQNRLQIKSLRIDLEENYQSILIDYFFIYI